MSPWRGPGDSFGKWHQSTLSNKRLRASQAGRSSRCRCVAALTSLGTVWTRPSLMRHGANVCIVNTAGQEEVHGALMMDPHALSYPVASEYTKRWLKTIITGRSAGPLHAAHFTTCEDV